MTTTIQTQIIKIKSVETLKDVRTFFQQMNKLYGLGWTPDEDFEDYEMSVADRQNIVKLMYQSFQVCECEKIDIHEFGMKINYPLRKIYGIGTDKIQN
jgi:uncharacterized protein (UPF0248 family)